MYQCKQKYYTENIQKHLKSLFGTATTLEEPGDRTPNLLIKCSPEFPSSNKFSSVTPLEKLGLIVWFFGGFFAPKGHAVAQTIQTAFPSASFLVFWGFLLATRILNGYMVAIFVIVSKFFSYLVA